MKIHLAFVCLCFSGQELLSIEQFQSREDQVQKSDLVLEGDVVRLEPNVEPAGTSGGYDIVFIKPRYIFKADYYELTKDSLIAVATRPSSARSVGPVDASGPWGTKILPLIAPSPAENRRGLFFLSIINTRAGNLYTGDAVWTNPAVIDPNFAGLRDQIKKFAKHSRKGCSRQNYSVIWLLVGVGATVGGYLLWRKYHVI